MIREMYTKQAIREVEEMKLTPIEKQHFIGLLECVDSDAFIEILQIAQGISTRRFWKALNGDTK